MVTIGFNATYSVQEDAGVISVSVFVLMNSLARDLEVTLSTQDDTARGGFCTTPNLQGLISEGVGLKRLRSSLIGFSCLKRRTLSTLTEKGPTFSLQIKI